MCAWNLWGQALNLEPLCFHPCIIVVSMAQCLQNWTSISMFLLLWQTLWLANAVFTQSFLQPSLICVHVTQFWTTNCKQKPLGGVLGKYFLKIGMSLWLFYPLFLLLPDIHCEASKGNSHLLTMRQQACRWRSTHWRWKSNMKHSVVCWTWLVQLVRVDIQIFSSFASLLFNTAII